MEYSSPWSRAYRLYCDAAGAAFEKAFRRYLDGKQSNPMNWSWGLIKYASKQARTDLYRKETTQERGQGKVGSLDQEIANTDGLQKTQLTQNGDQTIGDGAVKFDDPAEVSEAKGKLKKLRNDPLELYQRGWITQAEAAKLLDVNQSTVSRRLKQKDNQDS